ncbi:MAG: group III truncated hemoglobin [Armatimonadetes bacterium]|nr:group III truncated hemoglobin [Armatimonadota bacterium]
MKNDIADRSDVKTLVDTFYAKVQENEVLGYIFNDVANVDWVHHLPKMYSFWASILLGEHSFSGNPMIKHVELSKITPITEATFGEWLSLFIETVDDLFEGVVAEEAKTRAATITRIMLSKIQLVQIA